MKQKTLAASLLVLLALLMPATAPTTTNAVGLSQQEPPVQPAEPPLEPGGFIRVEGTQLTRLGQPVVIKGVNYYPRGRPWAEMWDSWSGPQIEHELRLARDELGINAVRVLVPYDIDREKAILRLRELTQIAGSLDMRLLVALFDFEDHFPSPGSRDEERHFRYLRDIIGNFAGDDRIFAWDLHNEPDHYPTWKRGNADAVLTWLGRMADEVHRIAPNHLVTVGMGQYNNLWQPGPDGRRVVDYSDVVSVHIYNAPDTARQLYELRQHTNKPILLQEFGWPSGPRCVLREYSEGTQEWVYRTILEGSQGQVAGVFAWTLRDYHAGPTIRWDTREEYYGLYRPDDTLKPAGEVYRDYPSVPLPSLTSTSLPLTVANISPPGGSFAPKPVPESAYHVKDWFRIAWERLGGRGMFGLPLGEAFIRPSDQRVVQYFEAAVLEFYPEGGGPAPDDLTKTTRAMRVIQPIDLGHAYTAGREFPQHAVVPEGGRRFGETGYTLSGDFRRFYEGAYGEWRLGAPISEELVEEINGVPTRVQYFQKGSLEVNPTTGVIQFGQLGRWLYNQNCGQ
jgi:hypothetical protein